MLAPPEGITLENYLNTLYSDRLTHARVTFVDRDIVLVDQDIEASGITISTVMNGDENMTMGRAVMSSVNITFIKSPRLNGIHWNEEIKVEIGVDYNGETYWTTMGLFSGTKRYSMATMGILKYTANDRMQKFDTVASTWLSTLTLPMTVREMYHSMCDFVGVPYIDGDELPNIMNRRYSTLPVFEEGITLREILARIAEACGCYCKITPDGYCQMVWFRDHRDEISITGNHEFTLQYFDLTGGNIWEELEDKTWEELEDLTWADLGGYTTMFVIDGTMVNFTDPESSVHYPQFLNGNVYKITDNPFLVTSSAAEQSAYLYPIHIRLSSFAGYLPINMVCIGNPLLETGDIVMVEAEGQTVPTPIFQRTFLWNGSVTDNIDVSGTIQRDMR